MSRDGFARSHPARRAGTTGRVLGWLSVVLSAALVVGSLTAYAGYRKLADNIGHENVEGLLGTRPADRTNAKNILLIGSDTRSAEGTQGYGVASGQRSDTVILLHIPPGRAEAMLISFPRDSLVEIPSCKQPNGTMSEPIETRLNEAFSTGGPACTWKTIESLTDIHIDHFVMVNFAGFKNVVNALGGVKVCLPEPVNDPRSELKLPAGMQTIRGEQALGFVRIRHGIGDGSDLQRIQRQQEFLAGMVKKATSMGLLLNPPKLFNFLNAATESITTDTGFELTQLKRLALSMRGIKPSDVNFVTVPVAPSGDGATVVWDQPAASKLFEAIRKDAQLPKQKSSSAGESSSPPPSPRAQPSVPPPGIQVKVLNGTDIGGLAGRTAEKLEAAGFKVVGVGNATSAETFQHTVVRHDPELEVSANILAGAVSASDVKAGEELGRAVTLILGQDAQNLQVQRGNRAPTDSGQQGSGSTVPEGVEKINASQNACKTNSTD